MTKFLQHLIKTIICLFIVLFTLATSSSLYLYFNKERVISSFLSEVKNENNLDIKFTNLDLNIIDHFPYTTISFDDFTIENKDNNQPIIVLSAKHLNLTFNSINIIQGDFNVRSCILNNGEIKYVPNVFEDLISQFSSKSPSNDSSKTNITINKFILKNYNISIYDKYITLKNKIYIDNTQINLYIYNNIINTSIAGTLNKIYINERLFTEEQITFKSSITGNLSQWKITDLYLKSKSIELKAVGYYDAKVGTVQLNYQSNQFNIKDIQPYFPQNDDIEVLSGKTKITGTVDYNSLSNNFKNLDINFDGWFRAKYQGKLLLINKLKGKSCFKENIKNHYTTINSLQLEYDRLSAKIKAKIKGIQNPIILAEGNISYNDAELNFQNKNIDINLSGKVKILFSLPNFNTKTKILVHSTNDSLNYRINKIDDLDRINGISGTIAITNDLEVSSNLMFDGEPTHVEFLQKNIISCLKESNKINPYIKINATKLDIDYISELLNSISSNQNRDKNTTDYKVDISASDIKFMNYWFKNVTSSLSINNNKIEIQDFKGNGFDGTINGYLKVENNSYYIYTEFDHVSISKLFEHYNNFNQSFILHNNISGSLSGNTILEYETDEIGKIKYPTLKLKSDLTISDGKLVGMNKIKKLSTWLKLDQVKSIDFKTLHNRIEISDGCVKIPKMDIFSNVINMELSGEHYFTGNYTYWMKVNFSQILSRRFISTSNTDFENTSNGSINLYLKLYGDSNNYEIKFDKKSSLQKLKGSLENEKITLKELFREEIQNNRTKDSLNQNKQWIDSTSKKVNKFNIEWDEYDTLKVDNN
ncbi:MAG: AsmA-like C-terminal region-containing protein [Bacteroidales bacterium]